MVWALCHTTGVTESPSAPAWGGVVVSVVLLASLPGGVAGHKGSQKEREREDSVLEARPALELSKGDGGGGIPMGSSECMPHLGSHSGTPVLGEAHTSQCQLVLFRGLSCPIAGSVVLERELQHTAMPFLPTSRASGL